MQKKFDKELRVTWPLEHIYLKESGIPYTFCKVEDGMTVWKYKKTSQLFLALAEFYKGVEHGKVSRK